MTAFSGNLRFPEAIAAWAPKPSQDMMTSPEIPPLRAPLNQKKHRTSQPRNLKSKINWGKKWNKAVRRAEYKQVWYRSFSLFQQFHDYNNIYRVQGKSPRSPYKSQWKIYYFPLLIPHSKINQHLLNMTELDILCWLDPKDDESSRFSTVCFLFIWSFTEFKCPWRSSNADFRPLNSLFIVSVRHRIFSLGS